MPRSVRIEYEGAIYHVLCRGDRREAIFHDDADRELFLWTLGAMCQRSGMRLHSYVLMSNHYHLLLETPQPNLSAGMKWFQGTYTQRFNARHRQSGHLFQGRYQAIPVETQSGGYFAAVSEYIHLNPVRAGLVGPQGAGLSAYRWSSFPGFCGSAALPAWLERGLVFGSLDLPDEGAGSRRRYRAWMLARARDVLEVNATAEQAEVWRKLRRGWYLGSESFRDRLMDWAAGAAQGRKRSSYAGREPLGRYDEKGAEELLQGGLERLGLGRREATALKQADPRKQALAWWVKSQSIVGDEWITKELEMGHRSNVSRAITAFRTARSADHRRLRKLLHTCTD